MKLFLDQNKTLLPRVDTIYLLARLGIVLIVAWYFVFNQFFHSDPLLAAGIVGTLVAHFLMFLLAVRGRFDIKLAYLSSIIYDLVVVPTLVLFAGGLESSFYLLFFLTISVAAYVLRIWFATAAVTLVCILYLMTIRQDLDVSTIFDVSIRLGFFLVYMLAISYASEHVRRSEKRLLKLFDTLNMRTSELEKSQAQLEMIYENSRILGSILDREGVVKEIVRLLGQVLGYTSFGIVFRDHKNQLAYRARAMSGQVLFQLKSIDPTAMSLVRKVCEMDEPIRIKDIRGKDTYRPLQEDTRSVMVVPMNSHGAVVGVLTVESSEIGHFGERDLQMLSIVARSAASALENAELHKRTEELTIIDGLTETYNYRYFIRKLAEEKRRASRYELPLSLIMVDIDWFKKLNDTYGHEAGNCVLKSLAKVITRCIRDVDIFARYGGEEFVIILPQTPLHEARTIGERIRQQVEEHVIDTGHTGKLRITVSVGVSSYPENGKSQEELVSIADQALYQAKGEGRNHVCVI